METIERVFAVTVYAILRGLVKVKDSITLIYCMHKFEKIGDKKVHILFIFHDFFIQALPKTTH